MGWACTSGPTGLDTRASGVRAPCIARERPRASCMSSVTSLYCLAAQQQQSSMPVAEQDGVRHGVGTYQWPNGARYQGEWRAGTMHGVGLLEAANGATYQASTGSQLCRVASAASCSRTCSHCRQWLESRSIFWSHLPCTLSASMAALHSRLAGLVCGRSDRCCACCSCDLDLPAGRLGRRPQAGPGQKGLCQWGCV